MKRSRRGIVQFFKGNSLGKNVVLVTLSLLLFAGLCVLLILDFKNDNFNEIWRAIIGTIIGIFISLIAMFLLRTFLGYFEDELKVNKNTQEMLEIYPKDRYRKKIKISEQGDAKTFIYNEVFINNGQMAIEFIDHHNQHFVLNDFFESHFDVLLAAHGSSVIKNSLTIRLADVEIHEDENKAIFHFSRSNYYNHLVTNRAVDYLITSAITPRKLYAYGPYIPPLKDSPFSNHIGINALVFTSDGYLIFPKRGRKATISKGQITSSIAIRLLFKNDGTPFYQQNFSGQAGKDYILHDFLIRQLDERLYFDLEKLKADKKNIDVTFLGVGQNIIEGGKPQMYYVLNLKDLTKDNVFSYIKYEQVRNRRKEIDQDVSFELADYNSIIFSDKNLSIKYRAFNPIKKTFYNSKQYYEYSMLANLWHYINRQI